jgi:hydroxypyruvate isomerase
MCNGAEINLIDGFNDIKFHDTLIKNYTEMIPLVANAGFKILFALAEIKNKTNEEGLNNCVIGLKKLIPLQKNMV